MAASEPGQCASTTTLGPGSNLQHLPVAFASPTCTAGERLVGDEALDVVHEIFMDLPRLLVQYRGDGLSTLDPCLRLATCDLRGCLRRRRSRLERWRQ